MMSTRQIQCPKCQSVIRAPAEAARVKCPRCQTVLNLPARTAAAQPQAAQPQAAPKFTPTFPPSAARPAVATATADNEQPNKSRNLVLAAAIGGGVLILCLLVAGVVVAMLAMRGATPNATEPLAASDASNPAAATPAAAPATLPQQWQSADVLGASATFPPGAIEHSKNDSSGTHRVVSAETSALYELQVEINSPPGDDPRKAIELAVASRVDEPLRWTEIQRGGHSGYRAVLERGEPPVAVYLVEGYPLPSGRVMLSYQAFSHQSPSKRPDREEQPDAPSLDLADAFMASLTLPAELPATTDSMSIQTRRAKLSEAEKKQLYALYKVAFDQAHQKIRIPRGYARTQTEQLLEGILASEVQKLAAMFDVSEEEVTSIAAEGRALGW